MGIFKPKLYYKSIYDINYNKLKEMGITCLIFDLDNTLGTVDYKNSPRKTKALIKELQEDFLILICSNNTRSRIKPYLEDLHVGGLAWGFKPLTIGLERLRRDYHLLKKEMCIIGDQLVTDILAGNRYHITTVLVDPMGEKDLRITGINRELEKRIINRYQRKGLFERGKYYE